MVITTGFGKESIYSKFLQSKPTGKICSKEALTFAHIFISTGVTSADKRFLRDFYYVIVDEADAVLLDSANMPLVIAGSPRVQSNLYNQADFFVTTLEEDEDYEKAAQVNSNTQLYKQAGNSIVKNVVREVFKQLIE